MPPRHDDNIHLTPRPDASAPSPGAATKSGATIPGASTGPPTPFAVPTTAHATQRFAVTAITRPAPCQLRKLAHRNG
jgi:hypothetical protein